MNRENFANLMAKAQLAYPGTKLDEKQVEIYWQYLSPIDIDRALSQLDQHIKTSPHFPRVSDLRPQEQRSDANRTWLGSGNPGRYAQLEMQPVTPARRYANQVMLPIVMAAGGLSEDKLAELVAVKNAEADDYDLERGRTDKAYRKEFVNRLRRELEDQLGAGQ